MIGIIREQLEIVKLIDCHVSQFPENQAGTNNC